MDMEHMKSSDFQQRQASQWKYHVNSSGLTSAGRLRSVFKGDISVTQCNSSATVHP